MTSQQTSQFATPPASSQAQASSPPPALEWQPVPHHQIGAGWQIAPRPMRRRRVLGGIAAILGLAVLGVGLLVAQLAGPVSVGSSVMAASHGEISSFSYQATNGATSYRFIASRARSLTDGQRVACGIVRPVLAANDQGTTAFVVMNALGQVIATNATSCDGQPRPSAVSA